MVVADALAPIWRQDISKYQCHYSDIMMSAMASQITSVSIVCSTVCLGAQQRKHQSSVSLAFVRGIHWWLVDSPHKGPVTRNIFPVADVFLLTQAGRRISRRPNEMYTRNIYERCGRNSIIATSHERQDVINHLNIDCLFNSVFRLATKKNTKAPSYCSPITYWLASMGL